MFSNIIKITQVVVGVRGSQSREANIEIYPVAGMVLRSRRQNTLLQRLSSGVIIFECLVLLLNVSSGCPIVKLCQSFISVAESVLGGVFLWSSWLFSRALSKSYFSVAYYVLCPQKS